MSTFIQNRNSDTAQMVVWMPGNKLNNNFFFFFFIFCSFFSPKQHNDSLAEKRDNSETTVPVSGVFYWNHYPINLVTQLHPTQNVCIEFCEVVIRYVILQYIK